MADDGGNFAVTDEMQILMVNEYELRFAVLKNVSNFRRIQTRVDWGEYGASGKNAKVSIYKNSRQCAWARTW